MPASLRFPRGLYGVTPDWDDGLKLETAVKAAIKGGLKSLQLRHKTASPTLRRELALRLQPLCKEAGVVFIINDDWQLALDIKADGVHLGKHDSPPALVRQQIGPDMLLGVSCYADPDRAKLLLKHDVAYIAFGAMFTSSTKPQAPTAPMSVLTEGSRLVSPIVPTRPGVVAIGGITSLQAKNLITAGADSLAVVGGLFHAPNIEEAARQFSAAFS
jgi:thiamine-phosphate pyrophosphorylase